MAKNFLIGITCVIAGLAIGWLGSAKFVPAAGGVYNQVSNVFAQGLTAGKANQLTVDSSGNIVQSNGSSASIYTSGFSVAGQGHVNSALGYGTTTAGSATVPVATLCLAQTWKDPVGTPAITLTIPAASSTYATCSGAVAGAWSPQLVDNQSSNAITFATTTGGANINFMFATGTAAGLITYPPKIPASTTAEIREMFISTSTLDLMITLYQKPSGF